MTRKLRWIARVMIVFGLVYWLRGCFFVTTITRPELSISDFFVTLFGYTPGPKIVDKMFTIGYFGIAVLILGILLTVLRPKTAREKKKSDAESVSRQRSRMVKCHNCDWEGTLGKWEDNSGCPVCQSDVYTKLQTADGYAKYAR